MSILQFVENFNNLDFNIFKQKADISFLKAYKNKKILMIGYNKYETNISSIPDFDITQIKLNIDNYNLFVINPKINYKDRSTIKNIIKLFSKKRKDVIFYGYTSYLNLNLDNSNNMFRPIDITKEPFNIKNYEILQTGPYYYYFVQYICLVVFTTYLNIKFDKTLYKILIIIISASALFIPFKKILYIKNNGYLS